MKFDEFNEEVFFTTETITCVGSAEIDFLKERARGNRRQRARLCAHRGADDIVHEMLIVHARDCYLCAAAQASAEERVVSCYRR